MFLEKWGRCEEERGTEKIFFYYLLTCQVRIGWRKVRLLRQLLTQFNLISKTYRLCDKCGPQLVIWIWNFFFFETESRATNVGHSLLNESEKQYIDVNESKSVAHTFGFIKMSIFFLVQIFLIIIEKQTSQVSVICLFNFIITLPKC